MRHVQVQRASARDEPINLRRESTLSIVSQSFVRSFVRSSRSFVRSSRAHRARARVDVSVMIPPRRDRSIDRSSLARVSRSVDAIAIDDATIHIFILHSPVPRARVPLPAPRARRSRAIERTCARLGVATR